MTYPGRNRSIIQIQACGRMRVEPGIAYRAASQDVVAELLGDHKGIQHPVIASRGAGCHHHSADELQPTCVRELPGRAVPVVGEHPRSPNARKNEGKGLQQLQVARGRDPDRRGQVARPDVRPPGQTAPMRRMPTRDGSGPVELSIVTAGWESPTSERTAIATPADLPPTPDTEQAWRDAFHLEFVAACSTSSCCCPEGTFVS